MTDSQDGADPNHGADPTQGADSNQGADPLAWPSPDTPLTRAQVADIDEERKRAVLRFLGGAFLTGVALIILIAVLFG